MLLGWLYRIIHQYSQSAKARGDRFQVVLVYYKNFDIFTPWIDV